MPRAEAHHALTRRSGVRLTAALLALGLCALAGTAAAQDYADISAGYYDPANVGAVPPQRPAIQYSMGQPEPYFDTGSEKDEISGDTVGKIAELLDRLQTASAQNDRQIGPGQRRAFEDIRKESEKVAEQVWDLLTPGTRQLYRDALDRAKRLAETERALDYRDFDGEAADISLARSSRLARDSVRDLEFALTPMLQEVRRSVEQQARAGSQRR
jgi:hypothetical protein